MSIATVDPDQDLYMSREAYRQWAAEQPRGRFERVDGRVVAMAAERAIHADRKGLAWLALRRAIAAAGLPCHAYPDGMTVEVDDSDFEPDVVVHCGPRLPPDATAVPDPLIVVEVLSPRTKGTDLTRKLVAYFRVPTIRHYLILFADRPQVIHHRRREDDQGIDTQIRKNGEIRLDPPGITITVEEMYAD